MNETIDSFRPVLIIHNSITTAKTMSRISDFFKLGEAFQYFFRVFQKPDPSRPTNTNIRMMHGINRISIIMFVICLIVMIVRAILR